MDPLDELIEWAASNGVRMNGIAPKRMPGRGIGMVATRDIEEDEIILDVPTKCLRSLSTVHKGRLKKLPENITVHGILAAELVEDKRPKYAPWNAVCPPMEDFWTAPLRWPHELQTRLPLRSRQLLEKQKAKYARDWAAYITAFPHFGPKWGGQEVYEHAWLLVNSRTFYYDDVALKNRPGTTTDDHLALQPVADLFNHSDEPGCRAAYGSDGFSFRATTAHRKGDEIKIGYGRHSNDFLLVEYGFTLEPNCWDETLLDEVILSRFNEKQKDKLEEFGFLGNYVVDKETVCHRTQVALRLLYCKAGEWRKFVAGVTDGETSQPAVDKLLLEVLKETKRKAEAMIEEIEDLFSLPEKHWDQRDVLIRRWYQIGVLLDARIASLEQVEA
ncbi:SET domain-containing protein [Xylariaceae sp. FL0255]|nr:SET domain-containing protein [Xylariaceae sp. FL0255]